MRIFPKKPVSLQKDQPALFLDRDGVINHDYGYVHVKDDFIFLDGIFDIIKWANQHHFLCIVVTNQAGIGRGLYDENIFEKLTTYMRREMRKNDCLIDGVYYSPFHPSAGQGKYRCAHESRKPGAGMFYEAARDFSIDLSASIMIGDKKSDILAAHAAGVRFKILLTETGKEAFDFNVHRVSDLQSALSALKRNSECS